MGLLRHALFSPCRARPHFSKHTLQDTVRPLNAISAPGRRSQNVANDVQLQTDTASESIAELLRLWSYTSSVMVNTRKHFSVLHCFCLTHGETLWVWKMEKNMLSILILSSYCLVISKHHDTQSEHLRTMKLSLPQFPLPVKWG